MTEPHRESQKTHLTVALAQGTSAAKWARTYGVPKATAYRWSKEPLVLAQIESIRRRAIDRAVVRMARRMTWATDGIARLAKNAKHSRLRVVQASNSTNRVLHSSKGGQGTALFPLSLEC